MYFKRIAPGRLFQNFIECYWIIESDDTAPMKQKIIPDGFPEIIFHYRDKYRININNKWETQKKALLAGQIKKYFFLENTGASGVLGIKLRPDALTQLFGIAMNEVAGKVVPLSSLKIKELKTLEKNIDFTSHKTMITSTENILEKFIASENINEVIRKAIDSIFKSNGTTTVADICKELFITERQLQRLFKQYIGISPKMYSRIIRFNFIFELLKKGKTSWLDITYHSGYFDQSHFIRDFRSFTGEDPSNYFFEEQNMANFFLKKK